VGGLFILAALIVPFPRLAVFEAEHRVLLLSETFKAFFKALECSYSEGTEVHHARLRYLSDQMKIQLEELQTLMGPFKWECVWLPAFSMNDHQQLVDFIAMMRAVWQQAEGMRLGSKKIRLTRTHQAFAEALQSDYAKTFREVIISVNSVASQLHFRRVLHPCKKTHIHDARSETVEVTESKEEKSKPSWKMRCKTNFKVRLQNSKELDDAWNGLFLTFIKTRRRLLYGIDMSAWDGVDLNYEGIQVEIESFVHKDQQGNGVHVLFARNTYMFDLGNIVDTLKAFEQKNSMDKSCCRGFKTILSTLCEHLKRPTLLDLKKFFLSWSQMRFPVKVAATMVLMSLPLNKIGLVWGPFEIAFIASKDTSSSFATSIMRLGGTAIGAVSAQFMYDFSRGHGEWLVSVLLSVWTGVCSIGRLSKTYSYAAFCAAFVPPILLLGSLAGEQGVVVRMDRTVGAFLVYLLVDTLLGTVSARPLLLQCLSNMLVTTEKCLDGVQYILLSKLDNPQTMQREGGSEEGKLSTEGNSVGDKRSPEQLARDLYNQIKEGQRLLALATNEPELWRHPFEAVSYSKVLNAQEKAHKYLDLLMRACMKFPLDEISSLTSLQKGTLQSIQRMVIDVKYAFKEMNKVLLDLNRRIRRKKVGTKEQASALLLLKDLVDSLDLIYENETVMMLRNNLHHPVLSEKLILSYNAVIFSLMHTQRSFLALGHALWGMIEQEQEHYFS